MRRASSCSKCSRRRSPRCTTPFAISSVASKRSSSAPPRPRRDPRFPGRTCSIAAARCSGAATCLRDAGGRPSKLHPTEVLRLGGRRAAGPADRASLRVDLHRRRPRRVPFSGARPEAPVNRLLRACFCSSSSRTALRRRAAEQDQPRVDQCGALPAPEAASTGARSRCRPAARRPSAHHDGRRGVDRPRYPRVGRSKAAARSPMPS